MSTLFKDKIEHAIPSIIEISNYFVINGLTHIKSKMTPIPFEYRFIATDSKCPMTINQQVICNSNYYDISHVPTKVNSTIVDSNDPTIVYKVFHAFNAVQTHIAKYSIKHGKLEILKTVSHAWVDATLNYLSQDTEHIYLTYYKLKSNHILAVNKNDLSMRSFLFNQYTQGIVDLVRETFLFSYDHTKGNSFYFNLLDKTTFTQRSLGTFTMGSLGQVMRQENNSTVDLDTFSKEFYFIFDGADNKIQEPRADVVSIGKVTIDTVSKNLSFNEIIIDLNGFTVEDIRIGSSANNLFKYHKVDTLFIDSKLHLMVTSLNTHKEVNDPSSFSSARFQSTLLFEILENNEAKLIDVFKHNNVFQYMLDIPSSSKTALVLANRYGFKILKLDILTRKFIQVSEHSAEIFIIGVDGMDRIFIQSQQGAIEFFDTSTPVIVDIDYKDSNMVLLPVGDNMTSISIAVRDMMGRLKNAKVRVSLSGHQEFLDTGTSIEVFDTNQSQPVIVPIRITGVGICDFISEII